MRCLFVLAVLTALCIAQEASPVKMGELPDSGLSESIEKLPKVEQISGEVAEGKFNRLSSSKS